MEGSASHSLGMKSFSPPAECVMRSLLDMGRLESLETAVAGFETCITARNFFEPEAYAAWGRRILVDHPAKRALILPAGSVIDGDLILDFTEDDADGAVIGTILALGDLDVRGRLINESTDSGAFLLVGGNFKAGQVVKGAASVIVLGSLMSDTVFCDFCGGALVTGGDLTSPLVISNDHDITVGGTLHGLLISSEQGNMREALVADVFADPNDPDDEWPDGTLICERMDAGLPLLKTTGG
jgi:hypothetical protein